MEKPTALQYYKKSQLLVLQSIVDTHHHRPHEAQINLGKTRYCLGLALCNGDEAMELAFKASIGRRRFLV